MPNAPPPTPPPRPGLRPDTQDRSGGHAAPPGSENGTARRPRRKPGALTPAQRKIQAEIIKAAASAFRPEELFAAVVRSLRRCVRFERFVIASFEPGTHDYYCWHCESEMDFEPRPAAGGARRRKCTTLYEKKRPLSLPDLKGSAYANSRAAKAGLRSQLYIPLLQDGECIAHIVLSSRRPNAFTKAEEALLVSTADLLVPAIRHARLGRSAEERAQRLAIQNEIARAVGSEMEPKALFQTIVRELRKHVPYERCSIATIDPDGRKYTYWHHEADIDFPPRTHWKKRGVWHTLRVYQTKRPLDIPDLSNHPGRSFNRHAKAGFRSLLIVPVLQEDRCIAHLHLSSVRPGNFTKAHVELLTSLAGHLGSAIRNATLYREAADRTKRLEIQNEIARAVGSTIEPAELFRTIVREIQKAVSCEWCAIASLDRTLGCYRYWHHESDTGYEPPKGFPSDAPNYSSRVYETKRPIRFADLQKTEFRNVSRKAKAGFRGVLVVPILQENRCVAHLSLASTRPHAFTEEHETLLLSIASHLGSAIQNARLHEEANRSRDFFRSVVADSADPVIVADRDRRIILWNRAAESLYGYTEAEILGRHGDHIIPEEIRQDMRGRIRQLLQKGDAFRFDSLRKTKGGKTIPVSVTLSPVRDGKGEIIALTAVHKDLSERRRLEKRLFEKEKLEVLGQLASGVAHDFNNALAIILGRTELVREGSEDSFVVRAMEVIEKAALSGARTVKRLQNFARKREGNIEELTNLNDVVRDVAEMTRPRWKNQAENSGVRICMEVHADARKPVVEGDTTELLEALINLVNNAVDALSGGGLITLRTEDTPEGARVTVSDTGKGMTPWEREHALEPFFSTKGELGTGLGLSMVYGIVRRHKGNLEIESAPGKGTSVILTLPRTTKDHPGRSEAEKPSARPARILVLDDEPEIGRSVAEILQKEGHEVEHHTNSNEALAKLRGGRFHLLLSDLGMPGMTGWEVGKEVRRIAPETRVILMTGWGTKAPRKKLDEIGIAEILRKPFRRRDILASVSQVLAGPFAD